MRSQRVSRDAFAIRTTASIAACCLLAAMSTAIFAGDRRGRSSTLLSREFYEGKQLFEKSWEPGKPSPKGGDGLGPLYNEVSCVACHNQGGTGGGGAHDRDVVMVSAIPSPSQTKPQGATFQGEMDNLHPGFGKSSSIVLHRHATDPQDCKRLETIGAFDSVQTHDSIKTLRKGRRNTPALFGSGLVDAIPDEVLRTAEKRSFPNFPEIKGRVSSLPDGRLGRFGWKGQISSLGDFVRAACSNELGLEVPGHHQASLTSTTALSTPKLDMDEEECEQLTWFLSHLAPPLQRSPDGRTAPPWGYMVFESIGCATCHAPKVGNVQGIYSDMLLHDMGESSSDVATYYGSPVAPPPSRRDVADAKKPVQRSGMADATEWRTPPLWGVGDSAPYYHDGRAATLDDAIRRHDGEAAKTASRYSKLASSDRHAVLVFLSSLKVSEPKKPAGTSRKKPADRSHAAKTTSGTARGTRFLPLASTLGL